MSHSSGIPVSEKLKNSFGNAVSNKDKRLIKAVIQDEQVVEVGSLPITNNTWEQDIDQVQNYLDKDSACYIIFRLDSQGVSGYQWVLFCYVPDKAKVKDKMIYASTRSNLKQQLGLSYFSDEVFGTVASDFDSKGYNHHVNSKKMEAPLTEQEQIKMQEKMSGEIYSGGQSSYVHGVAFPVEQKAMEAIKQLASNTLNYVQISIDIEKEKILLDHSSNLSSVSDIAKEISTTEPRFHFFGYSHEHEGNTIVSYIFIYSCPDGSKGTKSAPVKMRMLYSSSKANVSNLLSSSNVQIAAKFEINSAEDINEEIFYESIHPKQAEKTKNFSKPSRPGKGGARLQTHTEKTG